MHNRVQVGMTFCTYAELFANKQGALQTCSGHSKFAEPLVYMQSRVHMCRGRVFYLYRSESMNILCFQCHPVRYPSPAAAASEGVCSLFLLHDGKCQLTATILRSPQSRNPAAGACC